MRRFDILPVLGAALLGCETDDTDDSVRRELRTTLAGVGAFDVTGTAAVTWNVGAMQFTATSTIANDVATSTRPWHVHFGSCDTGGGIVGPPTSYPPLMVGQDGTAQVTTTIAFELDASAPYHVNVHESAAALTTIVACGTLALVGGDDDDDDDEDDDGDEGPGY